MGMCRGVKKGVGGGGTPNAADLHGIVSSGCVLDLQDPFFDVAQESIALPEKTCLICGFFQHLGVSR